MSIFDDLYLDEENNPIETNEVVEDNKATNDIASNLFSDIDEPTTNENNVTSEDHDDKSHDDKSHDENNEHPSEEIVTTEIKRDDKSHEAKPLSYDDVDAYIRKTKELEEKERLLKEYQTRDAEIKSKQEEELRAKNESMPDPIYNPEEYRKWVFDQNKRMEQSYEQRFQQFQEKLIIDNITSSLDKSYDSAKEKYGDDVIKEAEAWAAQIIKTQPREAVEYLKKNPSWDYIANEYTKAKERDEYNRDPEAFINKKIEARNNSIVEQSAQNLQQEPTVKKTPSKSINSVSTAPEPKDKVPDFMKGLY